MARHIGVRVDAGRNVERQLSGRVSGRLRRSGLRHVLTHLPRRRRGCAWIPLTLAFYLIQFYRFATFLSIYNSILPPLSNLRWPAARVVAPPSWLRHLPQHSPRGPSTPHTPQVNQAVQRCVQ